MENRYSGVIGEGQQWMNVIVVEQSDFSEPVAGDLGYGVYYAKFWRKKMTVRMVGPTKSIIYCNRSSTNFCVSFPNLLCLIGVRIFLSQMYKTP